jgi:drug/metabolite transporter (DMT)-like permease
MESTLEKYNPHFLLFIVSVIWGFNFSVVKWGVMLFGPLSFALLRFLVGAPLLFLTLSRYENDPWIRREDVFYFLLLGLIGFGIYQPLWSMGLQLSLASHSVLILSLSPVVVTLTAFLRREELVSWVNLLGVGLGFGGVIFLVQQGEIGTYLKGDVLKGDLLTLVAAMCWGFYSYLSKKMLTSYSPLKVSTWSVIFGVLWMLPTSLLSLVRAPWNQIDLGVLGSLFYGTVPAMVLAYVFWHNGVRVLGASRTVSYQFLIQVFGVLAAWMFYRETLNLNALIGILLIAIGLLLSQRKGGLPFWLR